MRSIALILLSIAVAQASVSVTQTSNDGPHPSTMEIEVRLPNSNNKVRIPLARRNALEDVPMTLVENGVSRTFSARQVHNASHSHYRDVESTSVVSVREVNGKRQISGHVMHEGVSYFLEPVGDSHHKVIPRVKNPDRLAKMHDLIERRNVLNRKRRQTNKSETKYTVELHLLLDSSVWSVFKKLYGSDSAALTELHYYYTHILNGIDTAYRNIGTPSISVRCIGITISKSVKDDGWMNGDFRDGSAILSGSLEAYVKHNNLRNADHVMAFTRRDLYATSPQGGVHDIVGIAATNTICEQDRLSLIEDLGLHSWITASHELGHSLGSKHDAELGCKDSDKFILATSADAYNLSDVANSIRFSECSIRAISELLELLGPSNCLLTTEGSRLTELTKATLEGSRLTLDQVCHLSYPNIIGKFDPREPADANPATICARIFCAGIHPSSQNTEQRAPVGTPCGSQKTCSWDGQCTHDPVAPIASETCFWGDIQGAHFCAKLKRSILNYTDSCHKRAKQNCCKTLAGVCKGRNRLW